MQDHDSMQDHDRHVHPQHVHPQHVHPQHVYRETLVEDFGLAFRRFFTTNILLRCPACAQDRVAKGPFAIKSRCDACGSRFERYAGNFLVSMSLNYFVTVVLLVALGGLLVLNYGFFDGLVWLLVGAAAVLVVSLYRPMQVLTLYLLWLFGQVYPDRPRQSAEGAPPLGSALP